MNRFYPLAICMALAASLVGCASVPESITHQPGVAPAPQAAVAPPANGAIFQAASHRPIFEDRRARLVGDILTISINERTSAGKSAANSASKAGSTDTAVSKLF